MLKLYYISCRPDYDFGQAPMIITACKNAATCTGGDKKAGKPSDGSCKKTVVAGQKSGLVWSLFAENGTVSAGLSCSAVDLL
jgi:hypothetical protein